MARRRTAPRCFVFVDSEHSSLVQSISETGRRKWFGAPPRRELVPLIHAFDLAHVAPVIKDHRMLDTLVDEGKEVSR